MSTGWEVQVLLFSYGKLGTPLAFSRRVARIWTACLTLLCEYSMWHIKHLVTNTMDFEYLCDGMGKSSVQPCIYPPQHGNHEVHTVALKVHRPLIRMGVGGSTCLHGVVCIRRSATTIPTAASPPTKCNPSCHLNVILIHSLSGRVYRRKWIAFEDTMRITYSVNV